LLNKALSFVAAVFAVVLLVGSQTSSRADGTAYIYAYHGSTCMTYAYGSSAGSSSSGIIYNYDMNTGQSYNGFITNVDTATGTVDSVGYVNGWQLATSRFSMQGGVLGFHLYDYWSSQEVFLGNDNLTGPAWWGAAYIW